MMTIADDLARRAFNEINFSFASNLVLWTAIELEIFPTVAAGASDIEQLAKMLKCSERGVRRILDCLTAMGFLEKNNEKYDLTAQARSYFLPSSEDYVGDLFSSCAQLLRYWLTLPQAVRTGQPVLDAFSDDVKEKYNLQMVEALYQFHKRSAWELVRVLPDAAALTSILNVAAGSAVWSLPFASLYPRVQVTAVDFVPVLDIARKFARRLGVEERYQFVGGNIRLVDFGEEKYDLAILGHICHSEGQKRSQELIRKCIRALKRGGRLLIMDFIADEERKRDFLALVLSINALMGTDEGDTFTLSEYTRWLFQAGCKAVQPLVLSEHYPCIVAAKGY